jgi:putative PIN family toxin of toxin-antitoxin system
VVGVTADSNIYISALNFGGPPDKLLDMARAGDIELHISDDILGEVMRVLRDKFRWSDEALALAKDRIGDFAKTIQPGQAVQIVTADPTDNKIIECALGGESQTTSSAGDKHLLDLGAGWDRENREAVRISGNAGGTGAMKALTLQIRICPGYECLSGPDENVAKCDLCSDQSILNLLFQRS